MKKIKTSAFILVLFLIATFSFSAEKFTEFQIGLHMPEDASNGFIGGVTFGRAVDQNMGIGIALEYYRKTFNKEETIDTTRFNIGERDVIRKFEQKASLLPIMLQFAYQGNIARSLQGRIHAGIGYAFLWTDYSDFETQTSESFFYHGFAWKIGAGVSTQLSQASDLYAQVTYYEAVPSREKDNKQGFPTRTEVDMSGLAIQIGLRLYGFGF